MTDAALVAKRGIVEDVLRNHLDDLLVFVAAIRRG